MRLLLFTLNGYLSLRIWISPCRFSAFIVNERQCFWRTVYFSIHWGPSSMQSCSKTKEIRGRISKSCSLRLRPKFNVEMIDLHWKRRQNHSWDSTFLASAAKPRSLYIALRPFPVAVRYTFWSHRSWKSDAYYSLEVATRISTCKPSDQWMFDLSLQYVPPGTKWSFSG